MRTYFPMSTWREVDIAIVLSDDLAQLVGGSRMDEKIVQ